MFAEHESSTSEVAHRGFLYLNYNGKWDVNRFHLKGLAFLLKPRLTCTRGGLSSQPCPQAARVVLSFVSLARLWSSSQVSLLVS